MTFKLLKEHTAFTDETLQQLQLLSTPIVKDATFAKERGIVNEVKDFPISEDRTVINVDY